jgi:hypothetical protein
MNRKVQKGCTKSAAYLHHLVQAIRTFSAKGLHFFIYLVRKVYITVKSGYIFSKEKMGLEILENKKAVFILIFTAFALSFHKKRLHSEIYIKEKKSFFLLIFLLFALSL